MRINSKYALFKPKFGIYIDVHLTSVHKCVFLSVFYARTLPCFEHISGQLALCSFLNN